MKNAYRMYKRENGVYYVLKKATGERKSLETTNPKEAEKLLIAYNQTEQSADLNLGLGQVYLRAPDPKLASRTWQTAMDELSSHGIESTQARCKREMQSKANDLIRAKPIVLTNAEDLKTVLKRGGSATNNYLRRLHNLAVGNGWVNKAIIPPKLWEKPPKAEKRGITCRWTKRPSIIWNPDLAGPNKATYGWAKSPTAKCFSSGKPAVPPSA